MIWYNLLDTPVRVVKTNKGLVEMRDLDNKLYVLPTELVDTLPKVVDPKEGSVWRNKNSGDVFIYHDGNMHNPKLIVRLSFFLRTPHLWEEYGASTGGDFADRIQEFMEAGPNTSMTFTRKTDGSISVEYYDDESSDYACGNDVEEALDNLEMQQSISPDGRSVIL